MFNSLKKILFYQKKEQNNIRNIQFNLFNKLKNEKFPSFSFKKTSEKCKLDQKPTIILFPSLFSFQELKNFSNIKTYKNIFSDVFFYNLTSFYDVILLKNDDKNFLGYENIDDYNILSKKEVELDNNLFIKLNKNPEKCIILNTDKNISNFKNLENNILEFNKFDKAKESTNLKSLLTFLISIRVHGYSDFRDIIGSYKGKNANLEIENTLKKIFFQKNFFNLNWENNYKKTCKEIEISRIKEFEESSKKFNENKKLETIKESLYSIFNTLKSIYYD